MDNFLNSEIIELHDCLHKIQVATKRKMLLPPPDETDFYINVLDELLDRLSLDERLALLLLETHSTLLNLISERADKENIDTEAFV